jgi:hypothetical protein
VVKEARLNSVPLDVLKQRVGPESDIGKLIDAPAVRQRARRAPGTAASRSGKAIGRSLRARAADGRL